MHRVTTAARAHPNRFERAREASAIRDGDSAKEPRAIEKTSGGKVSMAGANLLPVLNKRRFLLVDWLKRGAAKNTAAASRHEPSEAEIGMRRNENTTAWPPLIPPYSPPLSLASLPLVSAADFQFSLTCLSLIDIGDLFFQPAQGPQESGNADVTSLGAGKILFVSTPAGPHAVIF